MKTNDYSTKNINCYWSYLIIEELIRNQISYFCISPGSRSTPLTIAAATHNLSRTTLCYDERGISYHAIGYARAAKKPAVVICTSGTALANCLPAVIEASNDMVPVIIISADRPPELRDTGANQTIDQVKIFQNYVRWEFDLPCPSEEIAANMVLTTINQAINRSITAPAGPVHLNCMFREPLAPIPKKISNDYLLSVSTWSESRIPYTSYKSIHSNLSKDTVKELITRINRIKKGILVAGKTGSKEEQNAIVKVARKLDWPVFADILSGIRIGSPIQQLIPYFDQLLLSDSCTSKIQPDMILHLGGKITSKRFSNFLAKYTDIEYIAVKNHPLRYDPLHKVSTHIQSDLSSFCRNIIPHLNSKIDKSWSEKLHTYNGMVEKEIDKFVAADLKINEISITRVLSKYIPKNHGLFLGNSMPVRDMDMYAAPASNSLTIEANRGVSGIDGTIASASGFAAGLNKPVTVLLGDIALLHDINSLLILQSLKIPFVIITINNYGGGIFSFLPVADFPDIFEKYFAAGHTLNFKFIAKMFNLYYQQPETINEFIEVYKKRIKISNPSLIEIKTNRNQNFKNHQYLKNKIKKTLKNTDKPQRTKRSNIK